MGGGGGGGGGGGEVDRRDVKLSVKLSLEMAGQPFVLRDLGGLSMMNVATATVTGCVSKHNDVVVVLLMEM